METRVSHQFVYTLTLKLDNVFRHSAKRAPSQWDEEAKITLSKERLAGMTIREDEELLHLF
jgi:hypothetical protein